MSTNRPKTRFRRRLAGIARSLRREDGFTLIELLNSMVVLGFLVTSFAVITGLTVSSSTAVTDQTVAEALVRSTLDQLTAALRQGQPLTTGGTPFATSTSTAVAFYTPDRTYSSGSPTSFHLLEDAYQVSGGTFQSAQASSTNLAQGPPWTMPSLPSYTTLVTNVVANPSESPFPSSCDVAVAPMPVFEYLNSSGCPTTVAANVTTVLVTLTVEPDSGNGRTYTYAESATLTSDEQ